MAYFGTSETILFWQDLWNDHVMKVSFPHLHSFAKIENITISDVLQLDFFHEHFNLPLSEIAFEQFCEVSMMLPALPADGRLDQWSYIWGNNTYSVSKVYNHLLA
jgi:hypothetical protein